MGDVLQSHSPRSVPVGFYLSPLHPRLMYLPFLLRGPIQHAVAQQGSLFRARDVEDWQLSVNRGVSCALLAWFFVGYHWLWWCIFTPCLPTLVWIIIAAVIVPTSLSTFGPAYTTATCARSTAITCPACGFLAHSGSVCQLQTLAVRGVFVPIDFGHWDLLPCFFWKLVMNSLIWSVLQHRFAKAFCRARVKPWLMKKVAKVSVVVTWAGLVGRVRWICFFTHFGASAPSAGCGAFSSGVSSEEYSNTTFLSALPPGLGSFFGLPFPLPLPIANGLPLVSFRGVCLVLAM